MNDTAEYSEWARQHGFRVTLGEIMRTHFACEYRKHNSLLRQQGWLVRCDQNHADRSANLYTFQEPQPIYFCNRQRVMVFS